MKSLLVAVDGSEGSHAAVDEAIALARDLGAALTFVFVRKRPSSMLGRPLYERQVSYDLRRARHTIGEAIETATAAGIECDGEIFEGDAADEIISLADNRHVDLIVVGRAGMERWRAPCSEASPARSCNTPPCPCSSRSTGRRCTPKSRKRRSAWTSSS